jgi:hypothetical protein
MAEIKIGDRVLETKVSFKFVETVKDKYANDEASGELAIYMGLIDKSPYSLVAFFDGGLSSVKNHRPTVEQIDDALNREVFNADDATFNKAFSDAVTAMEESGFLKRTLKKVFEGMEESIKKVDEQIEKTETDEEKKRLTYRKEMMEEMFNKIKVQREDILTTPDTIDNK